MFETEGNVSAKWESALQTRGLAQHSLGGEVIGKVKCMRTELGIADPGLCPGLLRFCSFKMPEGLCSLLLPFALKKTTSGSSDTRGCF